MGGCAVIYYQYNYVETVLVGFGVTVCGGGPYVGHSTYVLHFILTGTVGWGQSVHKRPSRVLA
jgi:hypothetical protein